MVKFPLLALAFGFAHAEIDGKWYTINIAADNADMIVPAGPLRLYVCEIHCDDGVEGDNEFKIVRETPEYLVFYSVSVDRASQKTNLIFVVGKKCDILNHEQYERLAEYTEAHHIPRENILDIQHTDTCPM